MKKSLLYLLMLVCSMGFFTGCSDDDEKDPGENGNKDFITEEIAGNYKGTLTAELVMEDSENIPAGKPSQLNIAVTKASETAINLSLKNFSFLDGVVNISEITLNNCEVTKNGDIYEFGGTTTVNEPDIQLTGTVNLTGTVQNGSILLNMDIPDANFMGSPQHVMVKYEGTRLTGSESSEAKITKFSFEKGEGSNDIVIGEPVINEEEKTITFNVDKAALQNNPNALSELVPTIEVSQGATLTEGASGQVTDFSVEVTYSVLSENGVNTAVYTVKVPERENSLTLKFSFENWEEPVAEGSNNTLLPSDIWASSSEGASLLPGAVLLSRENEGVEGYAAKIMSYEYPDETNGKLIPKLTSGSLYIGKFKLSVFNRLASTKFGLDTETIGIGGQPKTFKGYYKYKSGDKYIDGETDPTGETIIEGKKDECSIQAVLYEATDEDGKEVTLDGSNINTSDYRVAVANVVSGDKNTFTEFNADFEYLKEYDPAKAYKFAIICSSSKDGDKYNGAGGSTLIVDEFEVICE